MKNFKKSFLGICCLFALCTISFSSCSERDILEEQEIQKQEIQKQEIQKQETITTRAGNVKVIAYDGSFLPWNVHKINVNGKWTVQFQNLTGSPVTFQVNTSDGNGYSFITPTGTPGINSKSGTTYGWISVVASGGTSSNMKGILTIFY